MAVAAVVHSALKRRLITMSRCCVTTVLWLAVLNEIVVNETALYSTGVSLSSACNEYNSCWRSAPVVGQTKRACSGVFSAPQSLQAAVSCFPIHSRYDPKLPWPLKAMALYNVISTAQSSQDWILGRRVYVQQLFCPRLLQRLRLAHFGRRNCYQLLSDVTAMPDISLPFILLYDCNNFIWSFRFFECIIIWIIFKKYSVSQDNMTGTICAMRCGSGVKKGKSRSVNGRNGSPKALKESGPIC